MNSMSTPATANTFCAKLHTKFTYFMRKPAFSAKLKPRPYTIPTKGARKVFNPYQLARKPYAGLFKIGRMGAVNVLNRAV
jgi:hypothetical protein